MDYSAFFRRTLQAQGFDLVPQFNCFDPPYRNELGWYLKLPSIDFAPNTLVLLNFQDFVTPQPEGIVELQQVQQYYKDRARQVLVTHWPHNLALHYHGPVNLIEFSSYKYMLIGNLATCRNQWVPAISNTKSQAWQCLNGRQAAHRLRAARILQHWPHGTLSFGDSIPLPQWPYSTYAGTESEENFFRLLDIYGNAAVNIVTETQYDRVPGIITEKTIFAMLAEQIPIVIGHSGIVADCVDLGFDMFTDLVDVSYDHAPDEIRVERALELNRDLILGHIDLAPYRQRLRCQRDFLLDHYPTIMENRFMIAAESLARSWHCDL